LLISHKDKEKYLEQRAKKVNMESKKEDLNLKEQAKKRNKVTFKGVEIDTTKARVRINIIKDELN